MRNLDDSVDTPDLEKAIEYYLKTQENRTYSNTTNVEMFTYNRTQLQQQQQREQQYQKGSKPITPKDGLPVRWNNDEQRRVYAALTLTLQQEAPDSPSMLNSGRDEMLGRELIKAWADFVDAPAPSSESDDEVYRAVFAQETDYLKAKEKEKDYVDITDRKLPPELQWRKDRQEERKEAQRSKLVQNLDEFIQELQLSEHTTSTLPKCRICQCFMTSHSAALQGKLCQACHADSLAVSSKQDQIGQPRRQYVTNQNYKPYNPPIGQQSQQRFRRPTKQSDEKPILFTDLLSGVLQNTKMESSAVAEEGDQNQSSNPWCEMTDPDSGEIFYWNKETEEMQWELDQQ